MVRLTPTTSMDFGIGDLEGRFSSVKLTDKPDES